MTPQARRGWLVGVTLLFLTTAAPALAARMAIDIDNAGVLAEPIEQPEPVFPDSPAKGQEGWVRLSFVITPDGQAVDPIVIDSAGGAEFEAAAAAALSQWRFGPVDRPLAGNIVDIRFEVGRSRDKASIGFLRRYRRIMNDLYNERVDNAREQVEKTRELSVNLYEITMFSLMLGRIEGAEGDEYGKLENYRRALRISNNASIEGEARCELLTSLFELQFAHGHLLAAQATLDLLRQEALRARGMARLQDKIDALHERLSANTSFRATARLDNASGCDACQPVWSHQPARRTFSFAALNGNVETFEVRCEHHRLQGTVNADSRWSLPEEAGSCRVFVFGDDGAHFEFVEHGDARADDPGAAPPAVARSDVLD
jgi:TonB family protein